MPPQVLTATPLEIMEPSVSPEERALAHALVDRARSGKTPITYSQAARDAGLPDHLISRASQIAKKISFQRYLQLMGVTPEFIASCLQADILKKPGNRVPELKLLSQVTGLIGEDRGRQEPQAVSQALTFIVNLINADGHLPSGSAAAALAGDWPGGVPGGAAPAGAGAPVLAEWESAAGAERDALLAALAGAEDSQ